MRADTTSSTGTAATIWALALSLIHIYARGNVAYLCGDNWWSQTAYKLLALAMLLVGGTQAYTCLLYTSND